MLKQKQDKKQKIYSLMTSTSSNKTGNFHSRKNGWSF